MNTQQLLDSINAQSHKNHKSKLSTIPESSQKNSFLKDNQFTSQLIIQQPPQPPEFFLQILREQKKKKLINPELSEVIAKAKRQKQKNAYLAFNQGSLAYLSLLNDLSRNNNQSAHNMITDAMAKRFNKISYELESGTIIVNRDRAIKKREQAELLEEFDVARLLKIKEGNIRSKLDFLNYKMEEMEKIDSQIKSPPKNEEIIKKVQENLSADFALGSEKTKIASEYIKHMTSQRIERRKRQKIRQSKEKRLEQRRVAELKIAEESKDHEKRQEVIQRMEQRKKRMEEEKRQVIQKQEKVGKFLEPYKKQKPLFKKRSREFEQKLVQSNRYHEQKLKEIKEQKKSYSLNDITEHQKKYSLLKIKENQKKSQEQQMYLKSLKINNKQYFRGSIHEIVEEVDKQARQKDISLYQKGKGKKVRRQQYSKKVREDYKPKVDEDKRSQLLKVIEKQQLKKKKLKKLYKQILDQNGEQVGVQSFYQELSPKNHQQIGMKYLQFAKLRKKKIESEENDSDSQDKSNKEQTVNVLKKQQKSLKQKQPDKQLWEIRAKQINQMSNDIHSQKQLEQIKANFQNLDDMAAKKQKVLKHAKMTAEEHLDHKNALDNFYLQSIKNKIKLLQ